MASALLFLAAVTLALSYPLAVPSAEQLAWNELEMGCLIHFNMQTFVPNISYTYMPGAQAFNPTNLSTDNWIEACAKFGGKYAVLVAKHNDGFTLWPSSSYKPLDRHYTVMDSPYPHDIVKKFFDSCKKYGLLPGIYCSASFNFLLNVSAGVVAGGNVTQEQYNTVVKTQLTELWTNYGPLSEIWFDGGVLPLNQGGPNLVPLIEKLQPHAVVFNAPPGITKTPIKWVGDELGVAPDPNYLATSDMTDCTNAASGDAFGMQWCPPESDTTLMQNDTWFWLPEMPLRNLTELLTVYVQTVGRSSNLLLDLAPDTTGSLPDSAYQAYVTFGEAIRTLFYNNTIDETSGHVPNFTDAERVNLIELQEDLTKGQRIHFFEILYYNNGEYHHIGNYETIGYKRLLLFDDVETVSLCLHLADAWETGGYISSFAAKYSNSSQFDDVRTALKACSALRVST